MKLAFWRRQASNGSLRHVPLSALAGLMSETPDLADAYTSLLGNLRLSTPFAPGKSVMITSTQPNEGKTTVASCLAIAASLLGQSVLLVDGDLRRPELSSNAGRCSGSGLSEVLEGKADPDEAIHPVELCLYSREAAAISVMAAGGGSAASLASVDWPRAREVFQTIVPRFGIVLVDSSPLLAGNDALLLAGLVDAVLLVVCAGSSDRDEVRWAKEQFEALDRPLVGAVLNRFDPRLHGRARQPHRSYYPGPHA
jgi:capsular exopolysaccharide synthesis family protein